MDDVGQKDRPEPGGISIRAARIQDVAKLADVSTATVSRALATPERVSPEARARVLEAIAKTGYVPNPAARTLRSQKTYMVLVVLPDLSNTFFSKILRGIEETLFEAGYGMIISDLDGSPEKEAHFAAFTAAGRVDGAILLNGHLFGQSREGEGQPAALGLPGSSQHRLCEWSGQQYPRARALPGIQGRIGDSWSAVRPGPRPSGGLHHRGGRAGWSGPGGTTHPSDSRVLHQR
jgi:hypothetical protein